MTTQYYTYDKVSKCLRQAPRPLHLSRGIVPSPTAEEYASIGAYPRSYVAPEQHEGKVAVQDGYILNGNKWVPQYIYEDAPLPPPRVFSKLRIVTELTAEGVWPQVKSLIEQAGLYDLYLAAQVFAEGNEHFDNGKAMLQEALGWSDEKVESVLSKCIS